MADKEYWCASRDEERFEGEYATREEAIAAYPEEYELDPGDTFYTGKACFMTAAHAGLADSVVDALQEEAYGLAGEFAEDWLTDVSTEDTADLEKILCKVVDDWMERRNLKPSFYYITDVLSHEVPGGGPEGSSLASENEGAAEC